MASRLDTTVNAERMIEEMRTTFIKLREDSKMTVKELSEVTGVSVHAITKFENGCQPMPIRHLAVVLNKLGYKLQIV